MSSTPIAVDLYAGLGGWAEGLLATGWSVLGFDIERHVYGEHKYPAQLVIQDVLTLHGSQLKNADLIVASPPCQEYSYTAMPWSRAKAKAAAIRADKTGAELERLNRLFNACFRIQREACEAAGRHIPLIVENVRGAIPWVGRSRWNFGSYHLWGDVPALMPPVNSFGVGPGTRRPGRTMCYPAGSANPDVVKGRTGKLHWVDEGTKVPSEAGRRTTPGRGARFTSRDCGVEAAEGRKGAGAAWFDQNLCALSSKSPSRKFASAMIAKIPLALSTHIALTFRPAAMAATG